MIHAVALGAEEDGTRRPIADVKVQRSSGAGRQRMTAILPPLRKDLERAVPAFELELIDVGTEGFGDPQTVERQE